jgi:DNA-binding CsgD family transcriptional regulator
MAAQTEAAVVLAEGDAPRALRLARKAFRTWDRVGAPYEAARSRTLAGLACRKLDDREGAQLELDAAMAMLDQLGAAPELARVRALALETRFTPAAPHGLTPRELEILQLVAAGKTNKVIAAELFVSDKTVERHLSNIFDKLDVSTRTAAAAYAYEHRLI